ncbi:CDP-diacylglycerol diphosphatase [Acinetobacter qingfengensis]|uniref:CDP-diacylglycerol pyrophosphatase n=1 Tax=Acinetobacter qingfengensis TaxID=1262585 RepID=A0A1E7RCQ6_9GAMM|nr:CDP-diacylglycerol diphosphatase [Acinetobacter qingfengensis]KAA8732111.1 CDP-diacylglycerol diphosphatase [Acinetobacter qingfengensis]OEY97190.1 hypothetical protein BJI46_01830 [Acinetobacter qingfengensis]
MKSVLRQYQLPVFTGVVLLMTGCQSVHHHETNKRYILWDIVSQRCGTVLDRKKDCLVHQPDYVVLRDINGPVQTLIIPTTKITGIEDQQLLSASAKNYFAIAWQYRQILDQQNQIPISSQYLSFSVNSPYGRTQDQLHIHASCLRPDVYQTIQDHRESIKIGQWQQLPEKIFGHTYLAQKMPFEQIMTKDPFKVLSTHVMQQANDSMAHYGIAMVSIDQKNVILLATRENQTENNLGSIEEIQDTHCKITRKSF